MQVFSIYKVLNLINNKIYIGFDSNWPKRQIAHKSISFNPNVLEYEYAFHRAIRLYGWDAFEWEVICQSLDGEYLLTIIEPMFIEQYESFGIKGYNMTKGGEGCLGYKHTDKAKEKLRYPKTEEHKQKLSKVFKNKPLLDTTRQKMSETRKGKKYSKKHRESISKSLARNYLLIDPYENEYEITNLFKFCKENNLHQSSFSKNGYCKGWRCIRL